MKVKICRIDKDLPLPEYHTKGAVAFDLIAREDTNVPPKEIILIPSNNIIKTPPGFTLVLAPRSSMPKKTGLSFPHSIGIIDQDYCGSEDEIKIIEGWEKKNTFYEEEIGFLSFRYPRRISFKKYSACS